MLISLENWARMPPAAFEVEPSPGAASFSSTPTLPTPRRAKFQAIDVPMIPAPMMATSKRRSGMSSVILR